MTRRITTFDIAREAGVSRTTVSHILNAQPGVHLSAKTKARVLATARRLGYVPNFAAQMLVTGRSQSIGLVFPRGDLLAIDGFIPSMIRGLNEVCRGRGYRLVMEVLPELRNDQAYLKLANSKRVDSLIIINPRRGDRALEKVLKSKFPVLIAGTNEGSGKNTIATQEGAASRRATNHLIDLGHRRIAHISHASLDYVSALRRWEGYRAALKAAGLSYEQALVTQADFSFASGYQAMNEILAQHTPPTGLFAGNDTVAIGAMLAIREAGLSVPDDIAVVGYDDVPNAAFACPPLTTIRTHAYEHGKLFAEAAIRLMNQEAIGSQQDALPLELVIRNSCGANSSPSLRPQQLAETASPKGSEHQASVELKSRGNL
jgi:DNA-binding LacI/PurR family transcriptional regulator